MLNNLTMMLIVSSTALGLWAFGKLRNHIISTLLSLEFASLSAYLYVFNYISGVPSEMYVSLIYLTLAACEGALGLSILVALIKHKGNDFLGSTSLTQC